MVLATPSGILARPTKDWFSDDLAIAWWNISQTTVPIATGAYFANADIASNALYIWSIDFNLDAFQPLQVRIGKGANQGQTTVNAGVSYIDGIREQPPGSLVVPQQIIVAPYYELLDPIYRSRHHWEADGDTPLAILNPGDALSIMNFGATCGNLQGHIYYTPFVTPAPDLHR